MRAPAWIPNGEASRGYCAVVLCLGTFAAQSWVRVVALLDGSLLPWL